MNTNSVRVTASCLAAVLLVIALIPAVPGAAASDAARGTWVATGNMIGTHRSQTATLLRDGRVLLVGGCTTGGCPSSTITAGAELYNPRSGAFSSTGSMAVARSGHTETLLSDGRVLVAGGCCTDPGSAEVYDPATGTWSTTGSMNVPRGNHSATLLPDGQVLVVGGCCAGTSVLASAELYNPRTGTWMLTGSMSAVRQSHTATLLPNGMVLVAGGTNNYSCASSCPGLASAELYDPNTGTWAPAARMHIGRRYQAATLLPSGQVLVVGGNSSLSNYLASAEVYDPRTNTWTRTGRMTDARQQLTLTLLSHGRVLAAGGQTTSGGILASAEVYDPRTGTWSGTGHMATARVSDTATLLPTGKVLVAGGCSDSACNSLLSSAELYTP